LSPDNKTKVGAGCQSLFNDSARALWLYSCWAGKGRAWQWDGGARPAYQRRTRIVLLASIVSSVMGFAAGYGFREWICRRRRAIARDEFLRRQELYKSSSRTLNADMQA